MTVANKDELRAALEAGDFDRVLKTPESEWIDFKSEPYRLDVPKGPWEYAKDVAAFANTAGGVIVVGYKTHKAETDLVSSASCCRRVPKHLVDPKKLLDALTNTVYPEVRDVTLRWYPPGDAPEGVLVIDVPQQHDSDKPFILKRLYTETGQNPVHALGIPTRSGAETTWMRAESLHAAIGRASLGHLVGSLDDLVIQLRDRLGETARSEADRGSMLNRHARMDDRIKAITREMEWDETPVIFLQAFPTEAKPVPDLHAPNGVRGALEQPSTLRPGGWHLAEGFPPEVRDSGLFVVQGGRSVVWLDRDGFITAGAAATPDFLGWAVNPGHESGPGPWNINSLAMIEYTLEFFRFVYSVLIPRVRGEWTFRVSTRGFKTASGGVQLARGVPKGAWWSRPQLASGDTLDDEFTSSGSADRDAFVALERIYWLFGLSGTDIPYARDGRIVEAEILAA
jgi:hypothetical protein